MNQSFFLRTFFHSALAILEPQIYIVVEQFGAENISQLSGHLVENPTDKNDSFIRNNEKYQKSFLFQRQRYEDEIERPQYGTKCWSVYHFT